MYVEIENDNADMHLVGYTREMLNISLVILNVMHFQALLYTVYTQFYTAILSTFCSFSFSFFSLTLSACSYYLHILYWLKGQKVAE